MARIFENGIGSSKKTARRFMETTALTAAGLALLAPAANAQDHAWSNFDTQYGNIDINTQIPNHTDITQHSDLYIGNSDNLDILSHQSVNIGQKNSGSLFVARSTREGDDPTRILGSLKANGGVMVIDRNGVFMGPDSSVDVGSIAITTGDVTDEEIIAGTEMHIENFGDGKIELQGSITVAEAGIAAFVSPFVSNSGVINAKMGKVVMAGGEKVTLDLYGDNLVEIAVDDKAADALLENAGVINAEGGQVLMTAQAAKDITNNIINVSGVINASSATVQGGKIVLGGGAQGKVEVSGTLATAGATGGGDITVKGQTVEVTDSALLVADAIDSGNGGTVLAIADDKMKFSGAVYARGGEQDGNGGFVEVSGYEGLGYNGSVDTTAANGEAGSFLLDPAFAIIHSGSFDPLSWYDLIISAENLADDMHRNSNVTVQADNSIDVGTDLPFFGNGDINLSAYNYTTLNTNGYPFFPWMWTTTTHAGPNTPGNLTLDSNTINFNKDLIMGSGNLTVKANTVNLDSKLWSSSNGGATKTLLGDAKIISDGVNTVNVESTDALIQQGVWLVKDAGGGTVNVAAGTFEEQVVIDKNLTLKGANANVDPNTQTRGAETVIKAPVSMAGNFVSPTNNRGVIHVVNADNVVIDGVEVDGNHQGSTNDRMVGIGYFNAGGEIKNSIVHGITDSAFSGTQRGNAIVGLNTAGSLRTLNVTNNEVYDFQKNGITLNGANLSGTISGNTVTGHGATGIIAQNGIQIGNGAGGTITNNDISGIGYTGSIWAASSILVSSAAAGTTVSDNTVDGTGYDIGLYAYDTEGMIIRHNTITGSQTGILAYLTDGAVIDGNNEISDSAQYGIWVYDADDVEVEGNTIKNTTSDAINVGESDDIVISDNTIEGAQGNGIYTDASDDATITENTVTDTTLNNIWVDNGSNATITRNVTSGTANHAGIALRNVTGATISENAVTNAGYGLYADGNTTGVEAHGNSVTNITNFLVWNNGTPEVYDASGNYWGTTNETTIAAKMGGTVDFTPYLAFGTDTDNATKGFQGDFSNLYVTLKGGQTGGVGRIQEGINLVNVAGTVNVNAGTYNEGDININKAVTVRGVNAATTIVNASGYTNGFVVDGNLGNRNAVLSYMTVKNAAQDGVLVKDTATMKFMQLNRMNLENNGHHGVALYGNGAQGLTILNSSFLDNGFGGGSRGEGDVLVYQHNGDVILRNVNIQNNSPEGLADYGVQIRGADTLAPGKVELDNVVISGSYRAAQLGIQRYDGLTLSMNDVVLGGQTNAGTGSSGWGALYLSELGGNDLNIGNTAFGSHAGQYITLGYGAGYNTTNNVDATGATFEGVSGSDPTTTVAQHFAIENKIFHKMDLAPQGLVTWHAGNLYVTGGGNSGKIQTAIDASDVNGKVHVDGSTYTENLLIDVEGLKLTGHGTTLQYDVSNNGRGTAGNLITVDANNVNIDPFTFDGGGVAMHGTYADGDAGLVIDGNTYQNFTQAGIYLNNTTDALVTGNTLNNTGVYGVLLTGGTGATIEGGSISNTLWDSIRVLFAGDTTIQNIALNNAGTSQGVNGVGSGIVFVGATGAKVDNATITNVARIGIYAGASSDIELVNNTITNAGTGTNTAYGDSIGKFSGIHVEGTNNLKVSNNTVNGATKDGINLGGLINAPYAGAVTGVVTIDNNVIRNTGEDGIDVTGGTGVSITANHVGFTETAPDVFTPTAANNIKGDGIRVTSSNGADINNNFIDGVSKNGVYVQQGTGIDVLGNVLNRIGQVGIYANQVNTLNIASINDLNNIGWQGIQIEGGSAATVEDNIIRKAGGKGISVSGTNGSTVSDNTVYNAAESGIVVNGGKNSTIDGNIVYSIGTKAGEWSGIQSNGVGEALNITNNFIGHTNKVGGVGANNNIDHTGINVSNGGVVTITGNTIDEVGSTGIKVHTAGSLKVNNNTVGVQSDVVQRGIDLTSVTNADVIGNTLDNILTYGLYGNAVNGLKFYDNDVTGLSSANGTGVFLTGTSNANVGNSDQTAWVQTGFWPWQGYFQTTDRDNRISSLNRGVNIVGGDLNNVVNNTITGVNYGVKLDGSTNADVLDNTITGNSITGIDVTGGSHYATVDGNTLTTFATGINIASSNNVTVTDNTLTDVLNGIVANAANILRIRDNDLTGRGNLGTGVNVSASDDVIIGGYDLVSLLGFPIYEGNAVEDFQNGINAANVTNLRIQGNRVEGTGSTGTGIKITNSNGALIGGTGALLSYLQSNYVTGFVDGIQSNNSNDAKIIRNTVEDSTGDGIRVDSVNATNDIGVQVLNNRVNNVARTGIWLKNQNSALVDLNRVDGTTSFSGIRVEGGNGVTVSNNRSNNTGTHGISANDVANLDIIDNFIGMHGGNIGADGINVVGSSAAEIMRNRINDTAGEGVYLEGSNGSHIVQNQINDTGSHGVHVHNSSGVFAQVNFIGQLGGPTNINGDGIQFSGNSQGATITGNRIANTDSPVDGAGNGISVTGNVTGTTIGGAGSAANVIDDVAWDGIRVERTAGAGTSVQVLNNDITTAGRVGIWLKNLVGAQVNENDIENTGLSGIRGEGGSGMTALNNVIDDAGTHGISTDGVAGTITLKGNKIGQNVVDAILGNGIYLMNGSNVVIGGPGAEENLVSGATNGIEVNNFTGTITVDNNTIEDSRGVGIVFSSGTNGDIILKGNKLTDNVTGARFESGRIDLTGASNIFTRNVTGMVFDRFGGAAPMSLVAGVGDIPSTNGTFGTTVFDQNSGDYIVFANNAFSNGQNNPVRLDASYVNFNGFVPNTKARDVDGIPILTLEEYNAIENKVWHFGDSEWLGQILFGKLPEINQEELFRTIGYDAFGMNGLNVRIMGLPTIPGGPSASAFNNIAPFAGGNTTDPAALNAIATAAGGDAGAPAQTNAQELNAIDTAAGSQEVGCWNDAINAASTGQAVSLNYGTGLDDVLNGAASCGSSL